MQLQCPRCGSTDIGAGYLIDYSDKFRQLELAPRSLKLSRIGRLLRPFRRLIPVNARICRECGAVTLEVDPNDFADAEQRYGRR
jgi:RNA polymerase subunit RPABC4/transcription elongation factor Spt4